MMEYQRYEKKIVPYIDGTLSMDDRNEFEAFVATHPDFQEKLTVKQNEILDLKNMIPVIILSDDSRYTLEQEMKVSTFNLLKDRPKNVVEYVKNLFEEWSANR
jgi:anti-sigma-K factor RskA